MNPILDREIVSARLTMLTLNIMKSHPQNNAENPFTCTGCNLYRWLLELDRDSLANLINFSCADETKLEDLTLDMIGCTDVD